MAETALQRTLMICLQCNKMGAVTWARDSVFLTNRKVVLTVDDEFIKVGNEVYCGNCLEAVSGTTAFMRALQRTSSRHSEHD